MNNNFQIDDRLFRVKSPTLKFYCALCGTKRNMSYRSRLSTKNYFQVIAITLFTTLCLYPVMNFRGAFLGFFIWGAYEAGVRSLFKKNIPCPHCGFDATWYKKDVREAKKIVQEFWTSKNELNSSKIDEAIEQPTDSQ